MNGWQPIETAPHNQTVLVFSPNGYAVAHFDQGQWYGECEGSLVWEDELFLAHPDPTHWMPLPEPPK